LGVSAGTVLTMFRRAGIPARKAGTNQWELGGEPEPINERLVHGFRLLEIPKADRAGIAQSDATLEKRSNYFRASANGSAISTVVPPPGGLRRLN